MGKSLCFDTNALIHLQKYAFNEHFYICWTVLEEIENLKNDDRKDRGVKAKANRMSKLLRENHDKYTVIPYSAVNEDILALLPKNKNDSIIVASIWDMRDQLIFCTDDNSAWNLASNLPEPIECVTTSNLHLLTDINEYRGYRCLCFTESQMARFYENLDDNRYHCKENEYVVIMNRKKEVQEVRVWRNGKFEAISFNPVDNQIQGKIKPRNLQQKIAFDLLQNKNLTIKILTGRYGTGKDYLMSAHAIKAVEKGRFQKIVWIRNNVDVADTKDLGALPGDKDEKVWPFLMPLADQLGGEEVLIHMIEDGQLEVQPLNYLRGRSIDNAILYCSEAENLTTKHVQLIIGRAGDNTQVWFNGDYRQSDSHVFANDSGLINAVEKLAGDKLFGYVKLETCERSETARLADLLDD